MAGKILCICTSGKEAPWGDATGVWLEELAAPYFLFTKAGYTVDICSIAGGAPPIAPGSLEGDFFTPDAKAFKEDAAAQEKFEGAKPLTDYSAAIESGDYAAIFMPGGHGTVVDFPTCVPLKEAVEKMIGMGKPVAALCHGPLCLIECVDSEGKPLVAGKSVTAFSNEEEKGMGLEEKVPILPETKLKELGGLYECADPFSANVCVGGMLVTGQNPASSTPCAQKVLELLTAGAEAKAAPVENRRMSVKEVHALEDAAAAVAAVVGEAAAADPAPDATAEAKAPEPRRMSVKEQHAMEDAAAKAEGDAPRASVKAEA
jgi:putative intracellular protease/amidase